MNGKNDKIRRAKISSPIRYSEAFKMEVVREVESGDLPFGQVQRKYGIKSCDTVGRWVR